MISFSFQEMALATDKRKSKSETKSGAEAYSTMAWYLKKSDGAVFGPVELGILIGWSEKGQIAPDDQISEDQKNWKLAPTLASLGMTWQVKTPDGQLHGPFNLLALKELLVDGSVLATSPVSNLADGQQFTLIEALMAQANGQTSQLQNELDQLKAQLNRNEAKIKELEQETQNQELLKAKLAAAQSDLAQNAAILAKKETLLADFSKMEARFLKDIQDERSKSARFEAELRDERAKSQQQLSALEMRKAENEKELQQVRKALAEQTAMLEGLKQEFKQTQDSVKPLAAKAALAEQLQRDLKQKEAAWETERAELQRQIGETNSRAEKALARSAELEHAAQQLAAQQQETESARQTLLDQMEALHQECARWKKLFEEESAAHRLLKETQNQAPTAGPDENIPVLRARISELESRLAQLETSRRFLQKAADSAAPTPAVKAPPRVRQMIRPSPPERKGL